MLCLTSCSSSNPGGCMASLSCETRLKNDRNSFKFLQAPLVQSDRSALQEQCCGTNNITNATYIFCHATPLPSWRRLAWSTKLLRTKQHAASASATRQRCKKKSPMDWSRSETRTQAAWHVAKRWRQIVRAVVVAKGRQIARVVVAQRRSAEDIRRWRVWATVVLARVLWARQH